VCLCYPSCLSILLTVSPRWNAAAGSLAACPFSTDTDSHDDFKPQAKAALAGSAEQTIQNDISTHDVFVYMKGVPQAPMCGFSNMACAILNMYGVEYGARNVLADPEVREGVKRFTAWPTIPQVGAAAGRMRRAGWYLLTAAGSTCCILRWSVRRPNDSRFVDMQIFVKGEFIGG
jgi:monothiol glutaredoxin